MPHVTKTLFVAAMYFVFGSCLAQADILFCDDTTTSLTNSQEVITNSVTRDDTADDCVVFSVTIDPTTDFDDENYFGGLEFYSGGVNSFTMGNNWPASAWSTYGTSIGDNDLNSANPEPGQAYQNVDSNDGPVTIVFKVDYVAGGNDNMTVWLDPTAGTMSSQPANLTTTFSGDFSFDTIQARIGNDGATWDFSNIKVATEFNDVVQVPEPTCLGLLGLVGLTIAGRRRRVA